MFSVYVLRFLLCVCDVFIFNAQVFQNSTSMQTALAKKYYGLTPPQGFWPQGEATKITTIEGR